MIRPLRPILAVAFVVLPVAASANAHAQAPCAAEAAAATKAGRDPSLTGPTERAAIVAMREGNAQHAEGIKRSRVVATQSQAAEAFDRAIASYVEAAMASNAPAVLYNLAQTYRAAGRYPDAIEQYRQFLARATPRAPLRELVECHIATMTAEVERAASTAPPRDAAPVEDSALGQPDPAREREPVPTAPALPQPPVMSDAPPHWYADGVGWGLLGGGLAVAGVGGFLLIDASALRTDAENEPRDDVRIQLRDRADDRQRWGSVTTAVGAVLVVGAVVKLAIVPSRSSPAARASLYVAPAGAGVAIGGRF